MRNKFACFQSPPELIESGHESIIDRDKEFDGLRSFSHIRRLNYLECYFADVVMRHFQRPLSRLRNYSFMALRVV
jgi:hypothetical protein